LYHIEVVRELVGDDENDPESWRETGRRILPDTGILGQFRAFEVDAEPFFV
jgi:hypothetical protein